MPDSDIKTIHVVVAVIKNEIGQVLLALRPDDVHQGGLWEFPGGKLEPGETPQEALKREIFEEIGIDIINVEPLIQVKHDYRDKSVLLNVWTVIEYKNKPYGKENQKIDWVSASDLTIENMPTADLPIIHAIQLPDSCLITPDINKNDTEFMQGLESSLETGIKLIQFRAPHLSESDYIDMARNVISLAHQYNARVMINHSFESFQSCHADGLHLTSKRLMSLDKRPVSSDFLLSASCHTEREIQHANKIGTDFIFISPVQVTKSHPGTTVLGWHGLNALIQSAYMPVFALGGLKREHIKRAKENGAQGIAAIRSLWAGLNE